MITEELIKFIEEERKKGKKDKEIRSVLLSNSWLNEDINEAFEKIVTAPKNENIILYQTKPKKSYLFLSLLGYLFAFPFLSWLFYNLMFLVFNISVLEKFKILTYFPTILSIFVIILFILIKLIIKKNKFKNSLIKENLNPEEKVKEKLLIINNVVFYLIIITTVALFSTLVPFWEIPLLGFVLLVLTASFFGIIKPLIIVNFLLINYQVFLYFKGKKLGIETINYKKLIIIIISLIIMLFCSCREFKNIKDELAFKKEQKADNVLLNNEVLEIKEFFLKPINLGEIDFSAFDSPGEIMFSVGGDFSRDRDAITFNYRNCKEDHKEDEFLKSYFDQNKKVFVELPKKIHWESYSTEWETFIVYETKNELIIKDEFGNVLKEFSSLSTRCYEEENTNLYSLDIHSIVYKKEIDLNNIKDINLKNRFSELKNILSKPNPLQTVKFRESVVLKAENKTYYDVDITLGKYDMSSYLINFDFYACEKDEIVDKTIEGFIWNKIIKIIIPDSIKEDLNKGDTNKTFTLLNNNSLLFLDENGVEIEDFSNLFNRCSNEYTVYLSSPY